MRTEEYLRRALRQATADRPGLDPAAVLAAGRRHRRRVRAAAAACSAAVLLAAGGVALGLGGTQQAAGPDQRPAATLSATPIPTAPSQQEPSEQQQVALRAEAVRASAEQAAAAEDEALRASMERFSFGGEAKLSGRQTYYQTLIVDSTQPPDGGLPLSLTRTPSVSELPPGPWHADFPARPVEVAGVRVQFASDESLSRADWIQDGQYFVLIAQRTRHEVGISGPTPEEVLLLVQRAVIRQQAVG